MQSENQQRYSDGGRVYLRPLLEEDVNDEYLSWFKDAAVVHFLDSRNITHEDAVNYIRQGRETGQWYMYAVIFAENDVHIGNLKIGPIQKAHKTSDLVTVIGRPDYWGKGLATEAIKIGNKIAFDVYDIRKLSGGIAEKNIGSIKCYTSAGWVIEARLKGHHLINGEPEDRVCVSCFNPKYFPDA